MSRVSHKKPLIVILGPTASGKTSLSIALAKKFSGQIVSADSRQIYTGMDIGTSKATKHERTMVPHALIDIAKPDRTITLSEWQHRAYKALDTIHRKGKIPFLVGGTGLYISSIVDNYQLPKVKPDLKLRLRLEKLSTTILFAKLKKLDPRTAITIDSHNKRRLLRALEFVMGTKQSFIQHQGSRPCLYEVLMLGVASPTTKLYPRINERVHTMIRKGLEEEVRNLINNYPWHLPSMQSIGYQEWQDYFAHRITKKETCALIQQHSRNYAKRQMTWFRRMQKNHPIHWVTGYKDAERLVKKFLTS